MALTNKNNALQDLIAVGADALNGLYDVVLNLPGSNSVTAQQLRVRCTGFTPPTSKQTTYTVKYKSATLTRPSSAVEVGQEFSLEFRLDAYYEVYKALCKLQSLTSNAAIGYAATEIPAENDLAMVSIYALTSPIADVNSSQAASAYGPSNANLLFKYHGCWISEITKPDFKSSGTDTINIKATFHYLYAEDPQTGLLN